MNSVAMRKCPASIQIESRFSGGPARKPATNLRYSDHAKGRSRAEFGAFLTSACKNKTTKKIQTDGCSLGQERTLVPSKYQAGFERTYINIGFLG